MTHNNIPLKDYKVLVFCMTYNQNKYIKNALNGFVMQKTNFPFVCLVMDDASTDGEQDLIRAWMASECDMLKAECYDIQESEVVIVPHIANDNCTMAFYFLKTNLYGTGKKGPLVNFWREHCEYEALCEGDDYWVAPDKLQMQVDLLDGHPELSACWTGYLSKQEGSNNIVDHTIYEQSDESFSIYNLSKWAEFWFTKSLTSMYRTNLASKFYATASKYKYARDVHLCYYLLNWGDAAYIHKPTGVYLKNQGGIYGMKSESNKHIQNYNCYKELYLLEGGDFLRSRYIASIVGCLGYRDRAINRKKLLSEGLTNSRDNYERLRLLYYFITPGFMMNGINRLRRNASSLRKHND